MSSERNVAVLAAYVRRHGDGFGERLPGLGWLDDLIDDPELLSPDQAARLALVLGGKLGLEFVPLIGRRSGQRPAMQDSYSRYGAHHRDLGSRPREHSRGPQGP